MNGVRYRPEGFEGQCNECRQWWALDLESFRKDNMRVCRACQRADSRRRLAELRDRNPDMRARHREAVLENQKAKRKAAPEAFREYQRLWYAANHVRLMAQTAERHAIRAEMAGLKKRKSSRIETPETLRIRAEFRRDWIAKHGPIRPSREAIDRREYNAKWMREYRRRNAA